MVERAQYMNSERSNYQNRPEPRYRCDKVYIGSMHNDCIDTDKAVHTDSPDGTKEAVLFVLVCTERYA